MAAGAPASQHSRSQVLLVVLCVVVTVLGSCGTLLSSNFWLQSFPHASSSGQFAVEFFAATCYFVFFLGTLGAACRRYGFAVVRQAFVGTTANDSGTTAEVTRRTTNRRCSPAWLAPLLRRMPMFCVIGLNDIGTSLLSFYAIPHTPEVLQALLQTTIPFFSLWLTIVFIRGERERLRVDRWLVASFLLMLAGLVVAALPQLTASYTSSHSLWNIETGPWVLVYILSCAVYSGWCVAQRHFLDLSLSGVFFTKSNDVPLLSEGTEFAAVSLHTPGDTSDGPLLTPDVVPEDVHKVIMLVGDAFVTMLLSVALLPIDAIPWFGTSPSVAAAWSRFTEALRFVYHNVDGNLVYGILYTGSEIATYFSCAFLNAYSPTLSSFVVQIAGPFSALVVIVFPSLNTATGSTAASSKHTSAPAMPNVSEAVFQLLIADTSAANSTSSSSGCSSSLGGDAQGNWEEQVAGTLLITVATVLYYRWDLRCSALSAK